MVVCQNGQSIRADLVGCRTIGRNAVGANQNNIHFTVPHERGCHVVADDSTGYAELFDTPML